MTKTILIGMIALIAVAAFMTMTSEPSFKNVDAVLPDSEVVETVELDGYVLKPGERVVLLYTGQTFGTIQIAANLPCKSSGGPNAGSGNDTPDVFISVGQISFPRPPTISFFQAIIDDSSDDTGITGPKNTCMFVDAASTTGNAVILGNNGTKRVTLPTGTTVTMSVV